MVCIRFRYFKEGKLRQKPRGRQPSGFEARELQPKGGKREKERKRKKTHD
jgi:hypothetical protein